MLLSSIGSFVVVVFLVLIEVLRSAPMMTVLFFGMTSIKSVISCIYRHPAHYLYSLSGGDS